MRSGHCKVCFLTSTKTTRRITSYNKPTRGPGGSLIFGDDDEGSSDASPEVGSATKGVVDTRVSPTLVAASMDGSRKRLNVSWWFVNRREPLGCVQTRQRFIPPTVRLHPPDVPTSGRHGPVDGPGNGPRRCEDPFSRRVCGEQGGNPRSSRKLSRGQILLTD